MQIRKPSLGNVHVMLVGMAKPVRSMYVKWSGQKGQKENLKKHSARLGIDTSPTMVKP